MLGNDESILLTPEQFERAVRGFLDAAAGSLISYESHHRESIATSDGQYEIDVTARFEALGAEFLVLVECKHKKRSIERDDVQVLYAKVLSAGAQKGILFSSSGFQQGAIAFADAHGVALVHMADGKSNWFTKGAGQSHPPPQWIRFPEFIGWLVSGNTRSIVSDENPEYLRQVLGIELRVE